MKHIALFDTSVGSDNVGDEIIMHYCQKQLMEGVVKDNVVYLDRIPTHLEIGKSAYNLCNNALYKFVCGTNILKTSIVRTRLWKVGIREALNMKDICLMGCGWGGYNSFNTDPYTKWVYKSLLSKRFLHAVRDEYTLNKLKSLGINNVIFTACPTMWNLTEDHCKEIPTKKSNKVVASLTHYKPNPEADIRMMDLLLKKYEVVYFWLQQAKDYEYLCELGYDSKVKLINPILGEYTKVLQNEDVDFIGSRLHGGIHALNHKRRTLILAVDNRAAEINKSTGLFVLDRNDTDSISKWIDSNHETQIDLPWDNIKRWKDQFLI